MIGNEELDLGTQDEELDGMDEGGQDGTGSDDGEGEGGDQYFLTVNDRTKYRTPQDAVKAFDEAGKRIAALSPWEKEVSQKFGGLTPQQVSNILLDYVELKKGSRNAAQPNAEKSPTAAKELTKEQKEVVSFLEENGFITQKQFKELMEKIDGLSKTTSTIQETADDQKFNSLVKDGRSSLASELTAAKIDLKKQPAFERAVRAWIDESDERVQAFYAGGEQLQNLIKEGFKAVCEEFGIGPVAKAATTIRTAQNKNQVLNRNPRTLPQSGSGNPQVRKPKGDEGLTPDVHRRAAELFEKITHGGDE